MSAEAAAVITTAAGVLRGRILHPGRASAPVSPIVPVSFWGGVGPDGTIVDVHHPGLGLDLAGTIVVTPTSRGSSSGSSVLAELIRIGRAPAGFVLTQPDAIIITACLVAAELYGTRVPVVLVDAEALAVIGAAGEAGIEAGAARD